MFLFCLGVLQGETVSMEHDSALVIFPMQESIQSIERIAEDGMVDFGQVDADLVRPARFRIHFDVSVLGKSF